MNELIEFGGGNPGAYRFLVELSAPINAPLKAGIIAKLNEARSIRGTNLYVLYSDLCDRSVVKVAKLAKDCPTPILEDACSRQDYSGRPLVEPYLN